MAGLGNNEVVLSTAVKDVLRHWDHAAEGWKDQARREFERDYIEALIPTAKGAVTAMTQIRILLQKAMSQCR